MRINLAQRIITSLGATAFLVMGLFPPWVYTYKRDSVYSERYAGYGFIATPPTPRSQDQPREARPIPAITTLENGKTESTSTGTIKRPVKTLGGIKVIEFPDSTSWEEQTAMIRANAEYLHLVDEFGNPLWGPQSNEPVSGPYDGVRLDITRFALQWLLVLVATGFGLWFFHHREPTAT